MGTLFWIFAAVWLLLQVGIPLTAKKYGPAVKARFVERPKTKQPAGVPTKPITAASLTAWITANPASAAGYACPVLLPCDFVFMFALTGALGFGSVWAASHLTWLSGFPSWVWWVLPAVYLAADLTEDVLLMRFLRNKAASYAALSRATDIKIKSVVVAIAQLIVLGGPAVLKVLFP